MLQVQKISSLVMIGMSALLGAGAFAQTPAVPKLENTAGAPLRLNFPDETSADFVLQTVHTKFTTSMRLLENTCKPAQVAHCQISFPYTATTVSTRWVSHPTRQGELLKLPNNRGGFSNEVSGTSKFPLYSGQDIIPTDSNSPFGEISCDNNEWIPWRMGSPGQRRVLITLWDEDFENGNAEFMYHSSLRSPSFNSFTARFEDVPLFESGRKILLGTPARLTKRFFLEFPLIAYRLQLTFLSRNLVEPDDAACQIKLEVDFSKVFETVTALFNFEDRGTYDASKFTPILAGSSEAALVPSWWLGDLVRWTREKK